MARVGENDGRNRRPGPIGFDGESKVTSVRMPPIENPGGIANAAEIRLETPRGGVELRVPGPLTWVIAGLLVSVAGVIMLSIPLLVVGLGGLVVAGLISYRNRSEVRARLRSRQGTIR